MRLLAFLAAIAVLFALSDASAAQPAYAANVVSADYSQGPSARAVGLRTLTWPGKVEPIRPRARAQTAWGPAPAPVRAPSYWDPAPRAPQIQPQPQPAPPPAGIYVPPAPRAVAQASSPADGDYQPPHFYSLYREYGQTPDPIPLSPQFFASSSPDLAQPPPPAPRTVTTSTGRVVQQSAPPSPDGNPG